MARADAAARVVRARVPERRGVDRRRARAAVAAPATCARASLLVSRIHRRRAAASCASAGCSRRATRSSATPQRALRLWASLGAARARRRRNRAFRSSATRIPRCPRCFDAWADGDDRITCVVPDGVGRRRARRVDRRQRAAPRPAVRARPPRRCMRSRSSRRTTTTGCSGLRRQLRARRGLVRARAVGRAAVRVAHLSAGRATRTSRSSTPSSTGYCGRARAASAAAAVPLPSRVERRRRRDGHRGRLARVRGAAGARSTAHARALVRRAWRRTADLATGLVTAAAGVV